MKALIVFYSNTGHTQKVAQVIAGKMHAELGEIVDREKRKGIMAYFRRGRDAWLGRKSDIILPEKNPDDFDLVIVGTPIWSGSLSSPVRTYLEAQASKIKNVAFFCSMGGAGSERTFHQMQMLCHKPPLATLAISERQLNNMSYAEAVTGFVTQIDLQMPRPIS